VLDKDTVSPLESPVLAAGVVVGIGCANTEDSVTGYTVVDITSVSVVRKVVWDRAGQLLILRGHAVTVVIRVESTVEVVN
jgi:hypothetical protein